MLDTMRCEGFVAIGDANIAKPVAVLLRVVFGTMADRGPGSGFVCLALEDSSTILPEMRRISSLSRFAIQPFVLHGVDHFSDGQPNGFKV